MRGYIFIDLCGLGGEIQQLNASCKTTHLTHHGQCTKAHPFKQRPWRVGRFWPHPPVQHAPHVPAQEHNIDCAAPGYIFFVMKRAIIIIAFKHFNKRKLCARIVSKYKKVVDNLVDLSNIKPIILDVNTMLDVTSCFFW